MGNTFRYPLFVQVVIFEIEIKIESIIGILRFEELLHLTTVSFRRSSQSFLAIDKTSYTHHFEQFVLFRRSDILQIPGN
mgnify:FL=1